MLDNVIVDDVLEVLKRLPHPDLLEEDSITLFFSDSKIISYKSGFEDDFGVIGNVHRVTLKKSWSTNGKVWVFSCD